MNQFTQGRNAPGWCERCQFKWPLAKLQRQPVAGKITDLLVCPDCLDEDHPQLMVGRLRFNDPQALRRSAPPREIELPSFTGAPSVQPVPGGFGYQLDENFLLDESGLA